MATPPKKPTGTTPPRRKAAARKATPPKAQTAEGGEGNDAPDDTSSAAAPKKPRAPRSTAAAAKAPPKPRAAAKRTTPTRTETARKAVVESAPVQYVAETREKLGDRNFFAAVLGATAAVGAAVAGLVLALRSGKPGGEETTPNPGATAHQPDGTDSSASFEAGIADENTIPDKLPNT